MENEMKITSATNVINKVKDALGIRKGKDLATFFDVRANTISSWKSRSSIPYDRIIQLCLKYNIDLNEMFYDNYSSPDYSTDSVQVPILYISSYLEYYMNLKGRYNTLPVAYFPRSICFNIIIQVSIQNAETNMNQLHFAYCKKVTLYQLALYQKYILMIKNIGFKYLSVIGFSRDLNYIDVELESGKKTQLYTESILEYFVCKGLSYS